MVRHSVAHDAPGIVCNIAFVAVKAVENDVLPDMMLRILYIVLCKKEKFS